MAVSVQSRVTNLAEELRPVLLRLARHLRRESRGTGLSPLDSQLIATIKHNEGIGVSELAELEQMTAPTMSAHVKRLEEAGLIARDASACTDKRRTSLAITREGDKALEAVRRRRNDWLAARLSELNEEEVESLLSAITPLAHLAGENF
ncbi:MAG TPA: MarR family transcriptional regulator [Alphaproteobacteria bacterium]|nr:MarR family transcriptional regulator [Alphaproteobacteria bacterium]